MDRILRRVTVVAVVSALALALNGCGSSDVAAPTTPTLPDVLVRLWPESVNMLPGSAFTFTADVSGTSNRGVAWRVVEAGGGSVNAYGRYTAPAGNITGTFHVLAISNANPAALGSATVRVEPAATPSGGGTTPTPETVTIEITPQAATIATGAQLGFAAQVGGTANTAVRWSLENPNAGTVSTVGLYTAPKVSGVYRVIVTSVANPLVKAVATVTVIVPPPDPNIVVLVSPEEVVLNVGASRAFQATVAGTLHSAVVWSVQERFTGGVISADGVYTAPSIPGTFHVQATSVADPSKVGIATVTVKDGVGDVNVTAQ
jgi:hypothetical protein